MKKLLTSLIFVFFFTASSFGQIYEIVDSLNQVIDSIKTVNDSLRARILSIETTSVVSDTTITVEIKNIAVGDSLFLFEAAKNEHITSITGITLEGWGVEECYFKVYYGDDLFYSGTLVNSQTFVAQLGYTNAWYITTNNALIKNQSVWLYVNAIMLVDPENPDTPHLKFRLNYHRD